MVFPYDYKRKRFSRRPVQFEDFEEPMHASLVAAIAGAGGGGSGLTNKGGGWYLFTDAATVSATTVGDSLLRATPVLIDSPVTVDRIAISIATASTTPGAVARLGIYGDSNGGPGPRLVDAGTVPTTATGTLEVTLSTPLALQPGRYWPTLVAQGSGASHPSFRHGVGAGRHVPGPGAYLVQWSHYTGLKSVAAYTGALPATFDINGMEPGVRFALRLV